MSVARFSVKNPVIANLLMVSIIVLGILSYKSLPQEVMPLVNLNWALISTVYPGVSPEEIEKLITVPLEEEIQDVKGIDVISSTSAEGLSVLSVKFNEMPDDEFRVRFQDLRAEVDKVTDLPEDAMDPRVWANSSGEWVPVISVHLYGDIPEKRLIELGKELQEELLDIPGVSKADLSGTRDRQIWVEADPIQLEGYGISPEQIRWAIASHGINVPGGKISFGREEVLLRTTGEFTSVKEIEKVIVRSSVSGQTVRVGNVATITDSFEDAATRSRINRKPAVSIAITKNAEGNSVTMTEQVKKIASRFAKQNASLIEMTYTMDSSESINDIMGKLKRNAWAGFVIVIIVLMLVLGIRNAVLTAVGIPISFLACFIFLHRTGGSFNGNSLFALVLVLGVIVDDAIIIVENCYRHLQMGKSWRQAAIDGTNEVLMPVLAATGTTVAVFLPTMLMPGTMGKFMRVIPITVSLALLASIIEAFIILPSHFSDWPGKNISKARKSSEWLTSLQKTYEKALRFVVKWRYIFAIGLPIILFIGALGIIKAVGLDLFSGEEVAYYQIRVTMPAGTNLDTTEKTLKEYEDKIAAALPKTELRNIATTTGRIIGQAQWTFGTNVGEIWLDLSRSYERDRNAKEIMDEVRERTSKISGPSSVEISRLPTGPPMGKPVEIKVKGKYLSQMETAAREIKAELEKTDGVMDVGLDWQTGKKEIRFRVDPERAAMYGLSVAQVGMAIRNAINGVDADKMYDGDEEIEIVVRAKQSSVRRPEDFLKLPLLTRSGATVTLGNVATYSIEPIYSQIKRYKQQRVITVFSNVDKRKTTPVEVNRAIRDKYQDIGIKHPGISLDFSGVFKEFEQSFTALIQLFAFGILLIYVILGAQFRSYVQPLVILLTVPFAFVGAGLGLLIAGNPFSISTLFGIVALAGIAVNDAIVLISFVNNLRAEGLSVKEAVIKAGRLRLRPILLTSITTIAGLAPMAIGLGGMSLTWAPLANTIVWGLTVSTLLTIFIIPAAFIIVVDDITGGLTRRFSKSEE
jgi:multidrug efflux pump subunit AcrB